MTAEQGIPSAVENQSPQKKQRARRRIWTEEEDAVLRQRYRLEGMVPIARDLGRTPGSVRRRVFVLGLRADKGFIHRGKTRRYAVNESFFDRIDTLEKAWTLGFLASDGHVYPSSVTWSIAREDRCILEKIALAMRSSHPIVDFMNTSHSTPVPMSKIVIHSARLAQACRSYGFGPRKTWDLRPPTLDIVVESAFWLGCIDGDGHIRKHRRREQVWELGLCGTWEMINGFGLFAEKHVGFYRPPEPERMIWRIRYCALADVQTLIRALYRECPIWLPRKRELADHILTLSPKPPNWSRWPLALLEEMRASRSSWEAVAAELGVCSRTLLEYRKRLKGTS